MIFKQEWFAENLTKSDGIFPAEVPGNLQYDYAAAKNWPDYQYADNYKMFGALEDDTWQYHTKLHYEAAKGETVWFHADGIDYRCEIYLNGELLLTHEGSFSPIDLDLTPHLGASDNLLDITILPHPKRPGAPVSRSQADQVTKAPVCYGWAWHPRLLVSGIWQDAYIETRGAGYIFAPSVTYRLSDDLTSADIRFDWQCAGEVEVSLFNQQGELVWHGREHTLHLDNVELWWCHDHGPQTMYTWVMESGDDRKTGRIGFRRTKLVMNAGAWGRPNKYPMSRSDAPATLELNGRRIFLKGSNYLTPDIFTGRVTEEKYRAQITLARDAHMNVFRCWGGCGCQKNEFYDLCDELGVMVWVEFPLACNNYSESDHYLVTLESEATAILVNLREHPSIAFWCGGNELFNAWSGMTEQHLALRLLDSLCYRYDRSRPFIMTSPLNGMAHGNYLFFTNDGTGTDSITLFRQSADTAYTEFGPPALGDPETVKRVIPESSQVFPIPKDDKNWIAHYGTANYSWRCQEDTLVCFPECKTLDEALMYSDLMQSMAYKCIFEEARRQWPKCSMAVNWCYNEPWYTVCNRHIINYDNKPLPSYYAIRDALRPVLATAGIPKFIWRAGELFTADIVLHNDTMDTVERTVTVTLKLGDDSTELLTWSGKCAAMSSHPAPTVRFKLPNIRDVRLLELKISMDDGTKNSYTLRYFPAPNLPAIRRLNEAVDL
ncbi:MAG: hypothetical protein E7632_02920 [Ruminococcaceae bacterium]|nr:hypothetical protein [Oscillospiraceae bacterium]